jgi:hypothetical protein
MVDRRDKETTMAAITIDLKSNEVTKQTGTDFQPLKPNELHGRVRMARFSFNTGAGSTEGENIALVRLPKGARVLRAYLTFEAMGAGATLDVGLMAVDGTGEIDDDATSDSETFFATDLDVSAAGALTDDEVLETNYGYELQKECYVVGTVDGANWAADKDLIGHVEYVVD